jgi:hypothetical protein
MRDAMHMLMPLHSPTLVDNAHGRTPAQSSHSRPPPRSSPCPPVKLIAHLQGPPSPERPTQMRRRRPPGTPSHASCVLCPAALQSLPRSHTCSPPGPARLPCHPILTTEDLIPARSLLFSAGSSESRHQKQALAVVLLLSSAAREKGSEHQANGLLRLVIRVSNRKTGVVRCQRDNHPIEPLRPAAFPRYPLWLLP